MPEIATIENLPPAPAGKTGWPWTLATPPLPATAPGGQPWPKVTVVTPSFNQGHYIEETIRSVLLQGYPDLEYIVMDGGSRDNTLDVIQRYEPFITYWTSQKDRGQSDAINRGFRKSTGLWVGWQNSDDFYGPATIQKAVEAALAHPDASVVYGSVKLCDGQSRDTGSYPTSDFDLHRMLPWANMFNQSMFFHRRVFDAEHFIDENLHHYIDHEYFWRLIFAGFKFQYAPAVSAVFRIHELAKGATQHEIAANELYALYKRVYEEPSVPASVRRKALVSMRNHCIDQFGKSRWGLFEKFTADMRRTVGVRGMGVNLALRRMATTGFGVANIDRVRRLKHRVLKPYGA
jgi:glycosyltransferase involved in cell wall biosynthesis